MQFILIAYDGKDDKALERRQSAREAHLKLAKEMYERGKWLYASAILDDNGKMIGSLIVCDFESKQAMQAEWLDREPYIIGGVWRTINIERAQVAPFCLK